MSNIHRLRVERSSPAICERVQEQFSAYLDGELSGRSMAALARHLGLCEGCRQEFDGWRTMQDALATVGRKQAPDGLQAMLRQAIQRERAAGTHLPARRRWLQQWHESLAPLAVRAAGGLALALVIVGGLAWLSAPMAAVEANDDQMAHLAAPRYLYSQVPPQPISTRNDVPIVIEARIDDRGRVYDFHILSAPEDPNVLLQVEGNLLASIFRPATVFGVPVRGQLMLTYSGVSVRG